MLIGKAIFKEDGTLIESELPNIVVGDKDSVRLNVSFFENYENSKLLDLSTYVVEAVFERPDGKISPALLLSIDISTENIKYLLFGNWLTEIAGIAQVTIRLKENDTVKSTGFLNIPIKDGNTPSDVVITEPQYDALSEAITAEESARILAVNEALTQSKEYTNTKLQEFKNYVDTIIYDLQTTNSNLLGEITANKENIANNSSAISEHTEELSELASKVAANTTTISGHTQQIADILDNVDAQSEELIFLQGKTNVLSGDVDLLKETKLNKIFSDVTDAPSIALTDYLVINAGGKAYRITVEQLQNIISEKTNYFKGQFSSLEQLNLTQFADGLSGGDYAYVNTKFTNEDGTVYYQFVMYVWDVEDQRWEETKSSQYLGVTTFQAFQESLLNGTFNVGAIKGNVEENTDNSRLLQNISINGIPYVLPSIKVDFYDEIFSNENAKNLKSITINGDNWNIIQPNIVIPDNSVGIRQANFIVKTNLFYLDRAQDNIYSWDGIDEAANDNYGLSDYIPLKGGKSYGIGTGCRSYAIYDVSKNVLSFNQNASLGEVIFEATQDGYLRLNYALSTKNKQSVNEGTEVLNSFPNYLSDEVSINVNNLLDKSITPNKTSFFSQYPNLFNKEKAEIGKYDSNGSVVTTLGNTYAMSEFIPVKGGVQYTLANKVRSWTFYNENKEKINANSTTENSIVVTPEVDGYIRFNVYTSSLDTATFNEGTTPVEPKFGYYIDKKLIDSLENENVVEEKTNLNKVKVVIENNDIKVISKLDLENEIELHNHITNDYNKLFNFKEVYLNNQLIQQCGDDITPIRTFTTVGANHGYPLFAITTTHDKTNADLGSIWTNDGVNYTLLKIEDDALIFGYPYSVNDYGMSSYSAVNPSTNSILTHVSGATNTADITATSVSTQQLYPSVNKVKRHFIVDGEEVSSNGIYYGKEFSVVESYNIMDYKSIIDFAQANVGTSYANDTINGCVRLSIIYKFTSKGRCLISHNIVALTGLTLSQSGFLQSIGLSETAGTKYRYIPDVKEISGYDFKNLVDMTNYSTSILVTKNDLLDESVVPNRCVEWLINGNEKLVGFSIGYIYDKSNASNNDRIANCYSSYWDLRNSKKIYPTALDYKRLNAGEYMNFECYRNFLSPKWNEDITNGYVVEDNKDIYVYIDCHKSLNLSNFVLSEYVGKNIEVVKKTDSFVLHNSMVDSDGILFSINDDYGYAILKLN